VDEICVVGVLEELNLKKEKRAKINLKHDIVGSFEGFWGGRRATTKAIGIGRFLNLRSSSDPADQEHQQNVHVNPHAASTFNSVITPRWTPGTYVVAIIPKKDNPCSL